jgi:hypothetical protein
MIYSFENLFIFCKAKNFESTKKAKQKLKKVKMKTIERTNTTFHYILQI